ncbi:hypothetical protein AAF712_013593 [Marasmius tenuissimus]|uniref:Uncharacterized protein n=1 Tax=Marasmius tenuissimus TaxID=585030 RepID=A0ABR2ZFS9_9AGAR
MEGTEGYSNGEYLFHGSNTEALPLSPGATFCSLRPLETPVAQTPNLPVYDLLSEFRWAIKSHATTSSFNFPLSHFPPHLHQPLKTGPWYSGRDLCRSDDPFDVLCSRREWDFVHEKEEERRRDEMAHARLALNQITGGGGPHEAGTPSEPVPPASSTSSTSSRSCKAIKVRGDGGKTRTVTLWRKERQVPEKLTSQLKTAVRRKRLPVASNAKKSNTTTFVPVIATFDKTTSVTLPAEYAGSYRGVAGRKLPRSCAIRR